MTTAVPVFVPHHTEEHRNYLEHYCKPIPVCDENNICTGLVYDCSKAEEKMIGERDGGIVMTFVCGFFILIFLIAMLRVWWRA